MIKVHTVGFLGGPVVKNPPCNARDTGLIPLSHFLGGSVVKNLPTIQEIWVQSLGLKDPLEKEMTTHSSVLAWRIPGTGESGRRPSMGSHRVGHD